MGGDALAWVRATVVFAATSQLVSTIFPLIRGAAVSASDNLIRPLLICRQAPVSTLAIFVGIIGSVSTLDLQARLRSDPGMRYTFARGAHPHIVGFALAATGVGALPVVDLVAVPAVQAKLLHSLAGLYGQGWTRREVSVFLGLLGLGVGVGDAARLVGRALVKLVPYLGQTLGAVWGGPPPAG